MEPLQMTFEALEPTAVKSRTGKQSSLTLSLCHSGLQVAVAKDKVVHVYTCTGLQPVARLAAPAAVTALAWSSDDVFLSVQSAGSSAVQVLCPAQPSWSCTVDEGVAGLAAAVWVPHQHALLTLAPFGLHCTAWHLHSGTGVALPAAKALPAAAAFAKHGSTHWCALLSRVPGRDVLQWFDTSHTASAALPEAGDVWPALHAPVELGTDDAEGLVMAQDGSCVWVVDSAMQCRVEAWSAQGKRLATLAPQATGLGAVLRTTRLSPAGTLLLLPTHAGRVYLYNALSQALVGEASPFETTTLDASEVQVFVSVPPGADTALLTDAAARQHAAFNIGKFRHAWEGECDGFAAAAGHVALPALPAAAVHADSPPRLGATHIATISPDDALLACVCASMPSVVWVYTCAGQGGAPGPLPLVAALCLSGAVTAAEWGSAGCLLLAYGGRHLAVWEAGCAYCVSVQVQDSGPGMLVRRVQGGAGGAWLLSNRRHWCIGHALQAPQEQAATPAGAGSG